MEPMKMESERAQGCRLNLIIDEYSSSDISLRIKLGLQINRIIIRGRIPRVYTNRILLRPDSQGPRFASPPVFDHPPHHLENQSQLDYK